MCWFVGLDRCFFTDAQLFHWKSETYIKRLSTLHQISKTSVISKHRVILASALPPTSLPQVSCLLVFIRTALFFHFWMSVSECKFTWSFEPANQQNPKVCGGCGYILCVCAVTSGYFNIRLQDGVAYCHLHPRSLDFESLVAHEAISKSKMNLKNKGDHRRKGSLNDTYVIAPWEGRVRLISQQLI